MLSFCPIRIMPQRCFGTLKFTLTLHLYYMRLVMLAKQGRHHVPSFCNFFKALVRCCGVSLIQSTNREEYWTPVRAELLVDNSRTRTDLAYCISYRKSTLLLI